MICLLNLEFQNRKVYILGYINNNTMTDNKIFKDRQYGINS